jgi:putative phage-type endonuclease
MIQGTKEWLELRNDYIGASDAPVIMGVSPWKTPFMLWEEKLGVSSGQQQNSAMAYGKSMEAPALLEYSKISGVQLSEDEKDLIVFHAEYDFMMCSLDGISACKTIAVEIKNVNAEDHALAKSGTVPEKYYPQLQHQLACLGHEKIHYFSYKEGDSVLLTVDRDDEYIARMIEEEKKFWGYVLGFSPPPMSQGDVIDLSDDADWNKLSKEWLSVNEQIAWLEEQEKALREALISKTAGKNSKGCGVALSKVVRKGNVDYGKIPELAGVDLEPYRKKASESWRITKS